MEYNILQTKFYYDLINRASSENIKIKLDKIGLGTGSKDENYSVPNFDEYTISLVDEVGKFDITAITPSKVDLDILTLSAVVPSNSVLDGKWITEVGVYGSFDGRDEQLLFVGSFDPIYKPNIDENSTKELLFKIVIKIESINFVNLNIDTNLSYFTSYYFGDKNQLKINKHNLEKFNFVESININFKNIGDVNTLKNGSDNLATAVAKNSLDIGLVDDLVSGDNVVEAINRVIDRAQIRGTIDLMPFCIDELPNGWYVCDGSDYELSSFIGNALQLLDDSYKANWRIISDGKFINIPNLFDTEGRGMFLRSVNNALGRSTGSIEQDSMVSHSHTYSARYSSEKVDQILSGAQAYSGNSLANTNMSGEIETRPINIGMLPCIYLGVKL